MIPHIKDNRKIEYQESFCLALTKVVLAWDKTSPILVSLIRLAKTIAPTKFPIRQTNKSNKYLGLLSKTKPTFPVYKCNSKLIITNNPNPNNSEPTILLVPSKDKYTLAPMTMQKPAKREEIKILI